MTCYFGEVPVSRSENLKMWNGGAIGGAMAGSLDRGATGICGVKHEVSDEMMYLGLRLPHSLDPLAFLHQN